MEQYVGLDWAYRRARWCAKASNGAVLAEDWAPADEDGLARLVARLGPDVTACVEMMSGAAWVRDRLEAGGWNVQVADARKAKAVASLAAKTGVPPIFRTPNCVRCAGAQGWCPQCPRPDPHTRMSSAVRRCRCCVPAARRASSRRASACRSMFRSRRPG
jgi:hypothetical protein